MLKISLPKVPGFSLLSSIFWLTAISVIITLGVRLTPPYLQDLTVNQLVENLANEPRIKRLSSSDLTQILKQQLAKKNIDNVQIKKIMLERQQNKMLLNLNYEARVPLLGNIDAVLSFQKSKLVE